MIRNRLTHWQGIVLVSLISASLGALGGPPQKAEGQVEEINTEFHFLGPDDTLLIHEEEGTLKGQVDVMQGEEESDVVLSYPITIGTRQNNHVEIKTGTIHRKYYRFSGTVERGSGHKPKDADYLRLVGDVEIISVSGETHQETSVTKHVIMKSLSASEMAEE